MEIISYERFINSSDFNTTDLSIYVDSIETISRIERDRHERRQRRKLNKSKVFMCQVEAIVHPTPQATINITEDSSEAETEQIQHSRPVCPKQLRCKLFASKTKVSPVQSSDENYFSAASGNESSTGSNKESDEIDGITNLSLSDSGTESENGVFQLRPRTSAMTNPKYRSTRARIIGLVLKREYANGGCQNELEQQERRERVLESLLREKKKCESLRISTKDARTPLQEKINKKPTAEMRFIDKALRYLTL